MLQPAPADQQTATHPRPPRRSPAGADRDGAPRTTACPEVLFGDETALQETLVHGVASAPPDATAFEATLAGLEALAGELQSRHQRLARRARVIAQSSELRERELMKLASWANALDARLRERGLAPSASAFAAEASIATFRVAAQRWIEGSADDTLFDLIREGFNDLNRFLQAAAP